ncbi:MAG TPA: MFS transporter [Myxococcaceae bacterium]|jgi:SHS family lactate transporter-like MFS transporter
MSTGTTTSDLAAPVTYGRWGWLREPTKGQWLSFGAAWLGWVLDGFDFCIYLLAMPHIEREFGVKGTSTALVVAFTMLVRMVGGLVAGAAADRWGRRLPLMISIIWFALCDGAIGFAPSFTAVVVLRTLFGLGMGAEWTAGATLAMENWPQRSRGFASGVLQGSWGVGYILAAIAFGTLVPRFGWRALFWVGAAPALLVLPIRFWVPESPEWLARQGKPKEQQPKVSLQGMKPSLVWGSIAMVLVFSGYYAVAGQYPSMLGKQMGMAPPEVMSHTIVQNLGMLTGGALCGWMMMRFGIRAAMTVMMAGALLFVPLLVGQVEGWLMVGAYLGGVFGTGFTGVSPILVTRLYPAHVRARAAGIVYHVGAVGSAFVTLWVAALAEYGHRPLSWAMWVVAAGVEVAIIVCFWLQPKAAQLDPGD